MKKTVLTMMLLAFGLLTFAQTSTTSNELSNAERFSSKAGTLIQKEFVELGSVKNTEISVVHYTDLNTLDSISAVRFKYVVSTSYSTDTKIAILDSDEIEGLITSIKMMKDRVFTTNPTNYTEIIYKSRGGFEAGCFSSKKGWSTYLKLERFDSKSYVFLKNEDFTELLSLLEEAKLMIE